MTRGCAFLDYYIRSIFFYYILLSEFCLMLFMSSRETKASFCLTDSEEVTSTNKTIYNGKYHRYYKKQAAPVKIDLIYNSRVLMMVE